VFFLLDGMQAIAQFVFHFTDGTDIRMHDRLQIYGHNFAGDPGAWYEIMSRVNPTELISYVRCHARIQDAPPSGVPATVS
jgi:hypothetical protein